MTPLVIVLAAAVASVLLWVYAPWLVLSATTLIVLGLLHLADRSPRWMRRPVLWLFVRIARGGKHTLKWLGEGGEGRNDV